MMLSLEELNHSVWINNSLSHSHSWTTIVNPCIICAEGYCKHVCGSYRVAAMRLSMGIYVGKYHRPVHDTVHIHVLYVIPYPVC